jgi:hypothetical protein
VVFRRFTRTYMDMTPLRRKRRRPELCARSKWRARQMMLFVVTV